MVISLKNNVQLENSDWFKEYNSIEKNSIDLILTDPPYGKMEKMDWDKKVNIKLLQDSFDHVLKENGLIILFCDFSLLLRYSASFDKFILRSYHIWQKTSAMPISQLMPLPDSEFILVLKRINSKTIDTTWKPFQWNNKGKPYLKKSNILESPTRRHKKSPVSINIDGKRWIRSVIPAPNKPNMIKSERSKHPTQKSESLLRELIRVYSNENDLILDPFSGSGSTLISAQKEGRNSIGYEIEEDYFNEAVERIESIPNQMGLFQL